MSAGQEKGRVTPALCPSSTAAPGRGLFSHLLLFWKCREGWNLSLKTNLFSPYFTDMYIMNTHFLTQPS